jgi:hypothetical protein
MKQFYEQSCQVKKKKIESSDSKYYEHGVIDMDYQNNQCSWRRNAGDEKRNWEEICYGTNIKSVGCGFE